MLPNFPDSEMENSLLDPEDHEDKAQKYPVRGTDDIRDEDLLSNSAFNSLEGNSRHAPSWKMLIVNYGIEPFEYVTFYCITFFSILMKELIHIYNPYLKTWFELVRHFLN